MLTEQEQVERVRKKIIDSLHWREWSFIGQGNAIFEGSLTQESEERIADLLLSIDGLLIKHPSGATSTIFNQGRLRETEVWVRVIKETL